MARTTVATDNFNRASLGTDWAQLNAANNTVTINSSIRIAPSGTGSVALGLEAAARWVGAGTFNADQYSSLQIVNVDFQTASYNIGVICRASSDTNTARDYYGASIALDGSSTYTTTLYKVVNGTYTSLYSAAQAWSVNDYLSLEVEGTTLRLCRNGTPLGGSFTLTDSSISAVGAPGVTISGTTVAFGDNWEGGNLTASTTQKAKMLMNSAAVGQTVDGVAFAAPTGGNITGTKYGEFTGVSVIAGTGGDTGYGVLKVPLSSIGNPTLADGASLVMYAKNTTNFSPIWPATVISE